LLLTLLPCHDNWYCCLFSYTATWKALPHLPLLLMLGQLLLLLLLLLLLRQHSRCA
jgi:hypothetical protein